MASTSEATGSSTPSDSALPALTTTFTPPADCLSTLTYNAERKDATELLQDPFRRESRCFPPGFYTTVTEFDKWTRTVDDNGVTSVETLDMANSISIGIASFSPGLVCPAGYTTAGEERFMDEVTDGGGATTSIGRSRLYCCPRGFQLFVNYPTQLCQTTYKTSTIAFITFAPTPTTTDDSGGGGQVSGFAQVFKRKFVKARQDAPQPAETIFSGSFAPGPNGAAGTTLPPSSLSVVGPGVATVPAIVLIAPGSHAGGLGTGAKAGIGIGVVVVFLVVIGIIFSLWRKKRTNKNARRDELPPDMLAASELHANSSHQQQQQQQQQQYGGGGARPAVFGAGGVHELESAGNDGAYSNPAFIDTTKQKDAIEHTAELPVQKPPPVAMAELPTHYGQGAQQYTPQTGTRYETEEHKPGAYGIANAGGPEHMANVR